MGMSSSGALSSIVHVDSTFIWQVPDFWTLEDAATIPVTYGTVGIKYWIILIVITIIHF